MMHHLSRTFALAAVLVLALTVFVSTGSATNVQPRPFGSTGYSDVRDVSTPSVDVRVHAPTVDVRSRVAPAASKAWAVKAWGSSWS